MTPPPCSSSELRELLARRRGVLARASVVSEGHAGGKFDTPTRSSPGSRPPHGQGPSLHDVIAERFRTVSSLEQLARAVDFAEQALAAALRSPRSECESALEFRVRVCRDHAGRHSRDVASIEKVSLSWIRLIRREAGLSASYGLPAQ